MKKSVMDLTLTVIITFSLHIENMFHYFGKQLCIPMGLTTAESMFNTAKRKTLTFTSMAYKANLASMN